MFNGFTNLLPSLTDSFLKILLPSLILRSWAVECGQILDISVALRSCLGLLVPVNWESLNIGFQNILKSKFLCPLTICSFQNCQINEIVKHFRFELLKIYSFIKLNICMAHKIVWNKFLFLIKSNPKINADPEQICIWVWWELNI